VGAAHLLYLKRSSTPVLRDRFFPGQPILTTLEHVVLERGRVVRRSVLVSSVDGREGPISPILPASTPGTMGRSGSSWP